MALVTVQLLFGINYVVSKDVVAAFPPLVWASARIIIASTLMLLMAVAMRRKHPVPDRHFFVPLIGYALLATVINQTCFLVGIKHTTSTNSAILNSLIPVFTLLIVVLRGQEILSRRMALGFVSALVGVLVLRRIEDFSLSNETFYGDLLTIINSLSYATFLALSKKFYEKHDPIWTTVWLFMYGSVGITIIAIPDWLTFTMPAMNTTLWAEAAFTIIGATLFTYFLNNWALAWAKSSHVAIFIYLQPVITSIIAWSWRGEQATWRSILSTMLIFMGLLMAISKHDNPDKRRADK